MYCSTKHTPPLNIIRYPVDVGFKGNVRPGYTPKKEKTKPVLFYGGPNAGQTSYMGGMFPRKSSYVTPSPLDKSIM